MAGEGHQRFQAVSRGDRFVLTKEPVTTRQLVMYAGASGDYNRIHYDHGYACEAGLGGVIAHGMLTMGFAAQCVTDWAGEGAFVRDLSGRFLHPVRPGDQVRITLEVVAKEDRAGAPRCDLNLSGEVAGRAVFAGAATVAWPA